MLLFLSELKDIVFISTPREPLLLTAFKKHLLNKGERGPEASFPTGWSACCVSKCSQKGPLLSCLPRLIFFVFLLSGVLVSMYWYLYVVLTLISIITSNANKHLFKYLLAIWILSFVRCL